MGWMYHIDIVVRYGLGIKGCDELEWFSFKDEDGAIVQQACTIFHSISTVRDTSSSYCRFSFLNILYLISQDIMIH